MRSCGISPSARDFEPFILMVASIIISVVTNGAGKMVFENLIATGRNSEEIFEK
jgi:hypothetical protein